MKRLIILVLAVAYVLCPIDIVPDVVPIAGYIDDLIAIVLALRGVLCSVR